MSKIKTAFFCNNCGYESTKWIGKCPACLEWNTFVEEVVEKGTPKEKSWDAVGENKKKAVALPIGDISVEEEKRIITSDVELNRVLGGGIVNGSITLVGGEPGIGKSTLMLQMGLMQTGMTVLYVSGEESAQQIKMRAQRLGKASSNLLLLTETSVQSIFKEIRRVQPELVIVDSIQTLHTSLIDSPPGSVSQVKESAAEFQRYAKESGVPVFLIGHITKDGNIAGPKILEHMVDTVLQFEGDRHYFFRLLRTQKNRFGSTSELGIYEMAQNGMRPVINPSELLITHRDNPLSGTAIAASLEGLRPMLIEVQALSTQSVYGTPQRTVSGFDLRRLQLLLAILEKRGGFIFGTKDVFVNIAGGIKVEDPSIDLAIICALLSTYEDIAIPMHTCFAGEVGLNGEIRAVNRIEQRIAEAEKLGFKKIVVSSYNNKSLFLKGHAIEVVALGQVSELYEHLFN